MSSNGVPDRREKAGSGDEVIEVGCLMKRRAVGRENVIAKAMDVLAVKLFN